jgi:hypothetical protein
MKIVAVKVHADAIEGSARLRESATETQSNCCFDAFIAPPGVRLAICDSTYQTRERSVNVNGRAGTKRKFGRKRQDCSN